MSLGLILMVEVLRRMGTWSKYILLIFREVVAFNRGAGERRGKESEAYRYWSLE